MSNDSFLEADQPYNVAYTVPSTSEEEDWNETVERIYNKSVTQLQKELVEGERRLLNMIPAVIQTPVYEHQGEQWIQVPADELANTMVEERITKLISDLRQESETAIKALRRLADKRLLPTK